MSAIVGVLFRRGQPVEPALLEQMLARMDHRAPDGARTWTAGAAGLGHGLLATTPDMRAETHLFVDRRKQLAITAEARLDNRRELLARFGLSVQPGSGISDNRLILEAYRRHGEACLEYLRGDFAFAIWDGQRRRMFCGRDRFGVKPFYYHLSPGLFACASEIKALLVIPQITRELNEVRIAEFMAEIFDDQENTFYRHIQRLPAHHSLIVTERQSKKGSYWSLDPEREIHYEKDEDYAARFRELFFQAVERRLQRANPLGSYLSGGLDSSSIVSVASQLLREDGGGPLPTLSAVFDEIKECDEREYITSVVGQGGIEPHYLVADRLKPLQAIKKLCVIQDEPFAAPNLFLYWRLNTEIHHLSWRVTLDGFDGDTTISYGTGYLLELARDQRWLRLGLELRGLGKASRSPVMPVFWQYIKHFGLKPVVARSRLLQKIRDHWRNGNHARRAKGTKRNQPPLWRELLHPEFIQRTDLEQRYQAYLQNQPERGQSERIQHHRALTDGRQPLALEILDKTAAAQGFEPRYPFWDQDLVEYCLALPPDQKLRGGWSRFILRRSLESVLPEKVRWRRGKVDFTPEFLQNVRDINSHKVETLFAGTQDQLAKYLDIAQFRILRNHTTTADSVDPFSARTYWQILTLSLFQSEIAQKQENVNSWQS